MKSVEEYICVDIQGFAIPQFIPKEMTLITQENVVHHFLFNAPADGFPHKHRSSIKWLEDYLHGISYSARGISFDSNIFQHFPANVVYVKGQQKEKFMLDYYDIVVNLESQDNSPKILRTAEYCTYHNKMGYSWVCSKSNAHMIKEYINENMLY